MALLVLMPLNPAGAKTLPTTIELVAVEGAIHNATVRFLLDTIDDAADRLARLTTPWRRSNCWF